MRPPWPSMEGLLSSAPACTVTSPVGTLEMVWDSPDGIADGLVQRGDTVVVVTLWDPAPVVSVVVTNSEENWNWKLFAASLSRPLVM